MTAEDIEKQDPKSLIGRAFRFSKFAHEGQKRENGEPYINHCLATAEFLSEWHLDETTVAAGLLHDIPRITNVPIEKIKEEFGGEIAFLVDGMTKISPVRYKNTATKIENLRKLILALSGDLRIIFIKLANRLHNLRTIDGIPEERRIDFAQETNDIYAALANQIGMQNLAGEMYDLCFPVLYPKEYEWLIQNIKDEFSTRHEYLVRFKPILESVLKEKGLEPVLIDFRAKRYSSLYAKLQRYAMDFSKIYDLITTWVVFKEVKDCYEAMGAIHQVWPPLEGRIKDYIASPKANGYRSLHTTIIGPEGKHVEIQIHTEKMHDENKNGLAAHWLYKQNLEKKDESSKSIKDKLKEIPLLRHLRRWQNNSVDLASSYQEFIEAMKIDFFNDRIFVLTPKGDVIDLPKGSTPLDFAYKIHSDVGNGAIKAEINNALKPLSVELTSGDVIKIITQKGKGPSLDWLKIAKTSHAREHIREFFNQKRKKLDKRLF